MFNLILAVQIIVAIAMVGLILIQHGKGADAGASFGAGASGTVFGAAGSANFLTRATAVLTAIFFATSLLLAIQAKQQASDQLRLDVDTPAASTTNDSSTSVSNDNPIGDSNNNMHNNMETTNTELPTPAVSSKESSTNQPSNSEDSKPVAAQ